MAQTRTCYFGLETFGLAPIFTQAASTCYPAYPIDGQEILNYIHTCNQDEFEIDVATMGYPK